MTDIKMLIEDFCECTDGCSFFSDYSGRFMYGARCVGVVCSEVSYTDILVLLCDYLRDNDVESASEALGSVCVDNLGLDMIVYFPGLATC